MIDQVTYWNGPAATRWVEGQAELDRMLEPLGEEALRAAAVQPGETVLDVGCGCGTTSLQLAERVGAAGRVVGLDVSRPMVERASILGRAAPNTSFVVGDAAHHELPERSFDLLFSRFGVMFFADPRLAFGRLLAALRPGGRLAFVCWRALDDNPWARLPFEAVTRVLGRPEPAPASAPGPFAFADAIRLTTLLVEAGFDDVLLRALETPLKFGAGGHLDDAVDELMRLGPTARLLVDRSDAERQQAREAVRGVVAPLRMNGSVQFDAATWIVTARR